MNVTRVDQPDPNVTLWMTETEDGAAYVDAPDEATALAKLATFFDPPAAPPAAPTAAEIAQALVQAVSSAADFETAKANLKQVAATLTNPAPETPASA